MKLKKINSGIFELMDDLGKGLTSKKNIMLGGGNPAHTPATYDYFSGAIKRIGNNKKIFSHAIQYYTEPKGYLPLRKELANYFKRKFDWKINELNICLTNGMQNGFYILLNYFTNNFNSKLSGKINQIFCAKLPDYIGYFDILPKRHFAGSKAKKILLGENKFRYQIDFSKIEKKLELEKNSVYAKTQLDFEISAFLLSSPNNPSSSVLSQAEINQLITLAQNNQKYIIFDHAYGLPFPNLIYQPSAMPPLIENTIHCFSFSKLGLPGIRLGLIVSGEELIDKISVSNGIQTLSPSSFNAVFINEALKEKKIDQYIDKELRPYYINRKNLSVELLLPYLKNTPALLHEVQGGFFLWLALPGIKQNSKEIYQSLKALGVVVVPGEYFFLEDSKEPYIRISFTTEEKDLVRGLEILGKWVRNEYRKQKI